MVGLFCFYLYGIIPYMARIPVLQEDQKGGWSAWVYPNMHQFREICCDCGLVHDVQFKIDEHGVAFRAKRNKRSTANARRNKNPST